MIRYAAPADTRAPDAIPTWLVDLTLATWPEPGPDDGALLVRRQVDLLAVPARSKGLVVARLRSVDDGSWVSLVSSAPSSRRVAQAVRVGDRYVVEVGGGAAEFRQVRRAAGPAASTTVLLNFDREDGRPVVTRCGPAYAFTATRAAAVMWSWCRRATVPHDATTEEVL